MCLLNAYDTNHKWCYDNIKNRLLLRKLTSSQSKNVSGVQGLVTFARVFWIKLEKLRDGFSVFSSLKHQGQHLLRVERPGTCSAALQPAVSGPERDVLKHGTRGAAWKKTPQTNKQTKKKWSLNVLRYNSKIFVLKDHSPSSTKSGKRENSCSYSGIFLSSTTDFVFPQQLGKLQPRLHLKHSCLFSLRFMCYCYTSSVTDPLIWGSDTWAIKRE